MTISVRQFDSAGGTVSGAGWNGGIVQQTFFESYVGFPGVQGGSALVAILSTDQTDTVITSITDNYGNTWTQVPNARVTQNGSDGYVYSIDVWRADNVAAELPLNPSTDVAYLQLQAHFTGTAVHRTDWVVYEVEGINGGSATAAHAAQDSGSNISSVTSPTVDGGSAALFVTAAGCSFLATEANTVDSPWSFGSSITGNLDQMNFTPFSGAYMLGSGSQAATLHSGSGAGPASYAVVNMAFGPAGSGNNGNGGGTLSLSSYSAGQTLNSGDKETAFAAHVDNGHTFNAVVYSGTLHGLEADGDGVGWVAPDAGLGDAAVPVKYSGEQQHVRAHPDHFTYSPRANGDRCKFVMVRDTGDDKHALAITKL